jgi:uncharacterized membrane protein YkvA (DUF1232 family)
MKFSLASVYRWYRQLVRNPQTRWWVVIATIIYLVSPLDLSPDIFPLAGQVDDLLLITLLVSELLQVSFSGSDQQWTNEDSQANTAAPSAPPSAETIDVDSVAVDD